MGSRCSREIVREKSVCVQQLFLSNRHVGCFFFSFLHFSKVVLNYVKEKFAVIKEIVTMGYLENTVV